MQVRIPCDERRVLLIYAGATPPDETWVLIIYAGAYSTFTNSCSITAYLHLAVTH